VDRAVVLYGEAEPENVHSLAPLCRCVPDYSCTFWPLSQYKHSALEQVQAFLESLQNRRLRIAAWVLAGNDKDRFAELNSALDKALVVFAVSLLYFVFVI
jgi:hypothetical protein